MLDLLRIIVYIVSERKVNRMDTKITLDAARINARYTQIEAAGLLGIAPETLRAYETGKRSPNWKTHKQDGQEEYTKRFHLISLSWRNNNNVVIE